MAVKLAICRMMASVVTLRIVQSDFAATIALFVVHEQQLKVLEVLREQLSSASARKGEAL